MPKFKMPEGFEIPPDAEEDGEFQVIATFKQEGDGFLVLTEIEGLEIKGYEKKDGEKDEDKESVTVRPNETTWDRMQKAIPPERLRR